MGHAVILGRLIKATVIGGSGFKVFWVFREVLTESCAALKALKDFQVYVDFRVSGL